MEKLLRVGLIQIIPGPALRFRLADFAARRPELLGDRQHHAVPRFLLHRVDERGEEDVYLIDLTIDVLVEEYLDRTDDAVDVRPVAHLDRLSHDARAEPA